MRNRLTSQLLKAFLNHKLKEYGKMTTLHIDTQAKHISLTANLLGETEPIDASMKYMLEESDGRTFFVPQELDCSREWLSLLAQQMLKDNVIRFEIPDGIATTVLKMLKIQSERRKGIKIIERDDSARNHGKGGGPPDSPPTLRIR